jgi:hypothetical protein
MRRPVGLDAKERSTGERSRSPPLHDRLAVPVVHHAQVLGDQPRRAPPTWRERPIVVDELGIVPARLRVAED